MNESLREELIDMRTKDLQVRQELLDSGELGNGYSPRMEAVHRKNAQRLKDIIAEHGWPDMELVGPEWTLAAWFIAQHAIGEPEFQRHALVLVREKVRQGAVPAAQEAYLYDRVAMYEGRSQRYGTQSLPCPDGHYRRWTVDEPALLNERRAAVGLPPIGDDLPQTEPTAEARMEYEQWLKAYEDWLQRTGWRKRE